MARGVNKWLVAGVLASQLLAMGLFADEVPQDRPVSEVPRPGMTLQSLGYAAGTGLGVASLTALLWAASAHRDLGADYGQIDGHTAYLSQKHINNLSTSAAVLGGLAVATLAASYFEPRWMPYFSKDSVGVALSWGAP
jgi:hypothetical protein